MTKKLQVGDDIYNYPVQGDINYGEAATDWADAITEAVKEIKSPGDISTTEANLVGTSDGTFTTGTIPGLLFDTSFVQRILVEGNITRIITGIGTLVESFTVVGAYNGTSFNISASYSGDETEVELDVNAGQFTFKSLDNPNTTTLSIKFKAKVIIDENVLGL